MSRGGPQHGPPHPPLLGAPRRSRDAPRESAWSCHVGGPDMAPHTPHCSARPGAAVTRLGNPRGHVTWGGPTRAPPPPPAPRAPPEPCRPSGTTVVPFPAGPRAAPPPPPPVAPPHRLRLPPRVTSA